MGLYYFPSELHASTKTGMTVCLCPTFISTIAHVINFTLVSYIVED